LQQALQDPIEASHLPLRIIIIIIVIVTIIFIGGFFLTLPLMPLFGLSFLERLTLEVLPLLLLLYVLCRFMLLRGGVPFLMLNVILLHQRLRGPGVDRPLAK
jgi:hypothetical protein